MTALNIAHAKRAFLLLQIKGQLERIEAAGADQLKTAQDACRQAVRERTACCRDLCSYSKSHVAFIATTGQVDPFIVREIFLCGELDVMAATLKNFCATHGIGRAR